MRIFLIIILLLCWSCKGPLDEDVFTNLVLTPSQVLADGQSLINVSVNIDKRASTDRRNFIFSTTTGTFTASGTTKYTTKAEYEKGTLVARAVLRAPLSPGEFTVTVQPEFDSPVRDFELSQTATAAASVPASIALEPSSFGIASNFAGEVFLTAKLKNNNGNFVSRGVHVLFEDELLTGGRAGGRFRGLQSITADSSKVSTYYASPTYPIGTTIKIRATVLDTAGQKTAIKDSVLINVNS